jgi:hypothetical protein
LDDRVMRRFARGTGLRYDRFRIDR